MARTFNLPHSASNLDGWLGYSHASMPPSDRQVVHGNGIIRPAGIAKLAEWYFLTDHALEILGGSNYDLISVYYDLWCLRIEEDDKAALFKLRFM
jgi:hypothetical protein